jgi:lipopolysaccharide biosynthesis glycosyltransferase
LIKFPERFEKDVDLMTAKSSQVGTNRWTFYRLFLCEILPDWIDKLLYLDTDTIINKPLNELFESDFEWKSLQVVLDHPNNTKEQYLYNKRLWVNASFNAGFLFFDFKKIRKNLLERCLQVFQNLPNDKLLELHDQDCLNMAFNNDIKIIDCKYNFSVLWDAIFRKDIVIYHFRWKIVKVNPILIDRRFKKIFWFYFDMTTFKNWRPKFDINRIPFLVIYTIVPTKFLKFIASFVKINVNKR